MTTRVIVDAHAGWPVLVTGRDVETGKIQWDRLVEPNTEYTFYVHSGLTITVKEMEKVE